MVKKISKLIKAKSILNRLNDLDAKFLTGQIKTPLYKSKRSVLRKQFEKLK